MESQYPISEPCTCLLHNAIVKDKKGQLHDAHDIINEKVVILNFSSNWCGPCHIFSQVLSQAHTKMDANKAKDVVVLLVPVEESEEQAVYNFETMPDNWLMLSHDSSHVKMLQKKFNIRTVPKVVSCKSNSTVLTMKGRTEIENKGAYAIYNWIELARAKPKHGGLVFVDMIDEEKAQAGKQT